MRTYKRLTLNFNWSGLRKEVKRFVSECDVCQRTNYDTIKPPGQLQPLAILQQIWTGIAMDFIDGLPPTQGRNVILVVVDRLSKYGHFIPIKHPYSAPKIADIFIQEIFRLGMLASIVSDRDHIFINEFWNTFFKQQNTTLCKSSAYHPQSDGQTEVLNQTLEHYLRSFVLDRPTTWIQWLPWAEWWYNSTFQSVIQMTPFQAVYGYPPPTVVSYLPGSSPVHQVDVSLRNRDIILNQLKENIQLAQNRMLQQADKHRSERTFNIGD